MDKYDARVYIGNLEERIDRALRKWKKFSRVEDKSLAQYEWQFGMARVILEVFWDHGDEYIKLECRCSRIHWDNEWEGLTVESATNVMDRVGNFAQIVAGKQKR